MNFQTYPTVDLFRSVYLDPSRLFGLTPRIFQSFSAIMDFKKLLKQEPCFKALFVSFQSDVVEFWVAIQPNDYFARDKIIDYEQEIRNQYSQKKFVFNILAASKEDLQMVPKKNIPV